MVVMHRTNGWLSELLHVPDIRFVPEILNVVVVIEQLTMAMQRGQVSVVHPTKFH